MQRIAISVCAFVLALVNTLTGTAADRPNILVAISDDQSYPHASAYGCAGISTPGFDAVAKRGVLFHRAFTPAPGCSPMRAAFLTGRYIWQNREAGTHASHFPADLITFPTELESAGYRIGYTGKPWGPGNFKASGRDRNPAGPAFNQKKNESPKGISATDYSGNFAHFLAQQPEDQPFCFWFGGHEPHRSFDKGIGIREGIDPAVIEVPSFLPDTPEIRSDLADYYFEIQWFDSHLARMLQTLEATGRLENTLVVVTSDNGMAFPRAKANVYEYGIHMPLAISWPAKIRGARDSQELVNLIDVTATIYAAAGMTKPEQVTGRSLMPMLVENGSDFARTAVFSGRERHSSSRWNSLGYPSRCVRTNDYLYIRNYAPERWPAGTPRKFASAKYDQNGQLVESKLDREHGGYHDIDACPSLSFLISQRDDAELGHFLQLSVAKRPREEFFQIREDAGCLTNLVGDPAHSEQLQRHRGMLTDELTKTGDLRETNFTASHIWETYPRYSSLRWFPEPEWASSANLPRQNWLEDRRPKGK